MISYLTTLNKQQEELIIHEIKEINCTRIIGYQKKKTLLQKLSNYISSLYKTPKENALEENMCLERSQLCLNPNKIINENEILYLEGRESKNEGKFDEMEFLTDFFWSNYN